LFLVNSSTHVSVESFLAESSIEIEVKVCVTTKELGQYFQSEMET